MNRDIMIVWKTNLKIIGHVQEMLTKQSLRNDSTEFSGYNLI